MGAVGRSLRLTRGVGFSVTECDALCPNGLLAVFVHVAQTPLQSSKHSALSVSSLLTAVAPNRNVVYHMIDGVERLEKYQPGGYHPVQIDDVLAHRYRIVDKLGHGAYSTIWAAFDQRSKRLVAVKVGIASTTQPQRECKILRALTAQQQDVLYTTKYLDEFQINGPNGSHQCLVMDTTSGNLKDASYSLLFPIDVARALAAKTALSLSFVHSRGFIHGVKRDDPCRYPRPLTFLQDVHLRNMLMKQPASFSEQTVEDFRQKHGKPETIPITRVDNLILTNNVPTRATLPLILGKEAPEFVLDDAQDLVLGDFGEAFSPFTETRLGKHCNTPVSSRAPEAFFEPGAPLGFPSDIWSLGLAIWDILGMKFLFSQDASDHKEIVAQQIDVLRRENLPPNWLESWDRQGEDDNRDMEIPSRAKFDIDRGKGRREPWPTLERAFEEFVQRYRRQDGRFGVFDEQETEDILDLMRGMLELDPDKRMTMSGVLGSTWMTRRALPALRKSEVHCNR